MLILVQCLLVYAVRLTVRSKTMNNREKYERHIRTKKPAMVKALRTINNRLLVDGINEFKIDEYRLPIVKKSYLTTTTLNREKITSMDKGFSDYPIYDNWIKKNGKHFFRKHIEVLNYEVCFVTHENNESVDVLFNQFLDKIERQKSTLEKAKSIDVNAKYYRLNSKNAKLKRCFDFFNAMFDNMPTSKPITAKPKIVYHTCYFSMQNRVLMPIDNGFGHANKKPMSKKPFNVIDNWFKFRKNHYLLPTWIKERNEAIRQNQYTDMSLKSKIDY